MQKVYKKPQIFLLNLQLETPCRVKLYMFPKHFYTVDIDTLLYDYDENDKLQENRF